MTTAAVMLGFAGVLCLYLVFAFATDLIRARAARSAAASNLTRRMTKW